MNVLIVHQNFPGQFPHIARALVARGDKVAAIGSHTAKNMPGVDVRRWKNERGSTPGIYFPATRAEADLIRAEAAARTALQLRQDGFTPDVIVAHPSWGETIHLKEVWRDCPIIALGELFYQTRLSDSNFDPEFPRSGLEHDITINAKGAAQALAFLLADRIICPTPFQASTFPEGLRDKIRILHEGLDFDWARRRENVSVTLPRHAGKLTSATRFVTMVNRTLEPLRGFHIFMRALPAYLAACPDAHAVIVGQNSTHGYGSPLPQGQTWASKMLDELNGKLDMTRVHFMGAVQYNILIDLFSLTSAHVYYTYPFVLSWSVIEAMACECLVIGSDTAPVHDVIDDGRNGILVPFFDTLALSNAMIDAVTCPERFAFMRAEARRSVLSNYNKEQGVTGWLQEIQACVGITA